MGYAHIVIVNDFAHVNGGAAQVALRSAIALSGEGYDVTVFAAVEPIMRELAECGVRVVTTGQHALVSDPFPLRAALQGLWNCAAARRMDTLLEALDPRQTIIHLHGWTLSLSSSIIRVALRRRIPVVCSLHEYFTACPNGTFFNYQAKRSCILTPLSLSCLFTHCDKNSYVQKLWRVLRQFVQRNWSGVPGGITHYISVSQFSEEVLRPFLPRGAKIHRVPNPILAERRPPALPEHSGVFASVGRIEAEKGPFLFASASRRSGCTPTFIGDGSLRSAVADAFPEAIFTGWMERTDLTERLSTVRVLVLPSLWYETQGMVVLEAAALGIPAIVPSDSAAQESVVDGVTGLWFKRGDVEDLSLKLGMMRDDKLVRALGRAAYHHFWSEPPTIEKHVTRLSEVYRQMTG